jgi:tetratricopeptide (TPR) repeat protein
MNSQQRHAPGPHGKHGAVIHLHDRSYTVDDAGNLAVRELAAGNFRGAAGLYDLILSVVPDHAEAHNNRGVALQEMKFLNDAMASYEKAIALRPHYLEPHLNRSNLLLAMRRLDDALAGYDRLIAFKPDSAPAFNGRGITLQQMKRPADALASYDKALALQPDFPEALNNRGLLLREAGQHVVALATYDRAVALQPGNVTAHNNRGLTLQALNRFDEALASFDRAVALQPGYAMAHNNRGLLLKEMRRFEESVVSFDRAVALRPDYAPAYHNRGLALLEMKRYDDALASCDKAIALDPGCAEAYSTRGSVLSQMNLHDAAQASCARAIELKPDYAEAYHNRGVILVNQGDMKAAEEMFGKAIALRPDFSIPLFSLAKIRKYRDADHPDIKAMRAFLGRPGLPASDRELLYFSLGKAYDDCGRYDESFECYRTANQTCNARAGYDPDRVTGLTDRIIDVFTKDFLAQPCPFASDSRSPLFVVGMPRSGTTLVASVLSNHRSVATAGELTAIAKFAHALGKMVGKDIPYPRSVEHLTREVAARVTGDYEKRLRRDVGTDVPFVVDKNPLNFRHLGLIAMLFPGARVIHCMRHPLDTGLSTYFQRFSLNFSYSFDLKNIGHFYNQYARVMEHWRKVLPVKMIEVEYEGLIADTERVTRATLEALGLDWDEHCLSPHTNPSPVETASNWQVRQPIHKQSVERWRHYEKFLGPLKEVLGLTPGDPAG